MLLSGRFGKALQDIPNARSLHAVPVARVGGIGIMAGSMAGWLLLPSLLEWWLVLPYTGLFVVSFLDDRHSQPVWQRLSAHFVAAGILMGGSGLAGELGIVPTLLLLVLIVWVTNLYNFMDGSDGLAGGMAVFGFALYGMACLQAQQHELAMLNFSISAAALAFLIYNFPPARVFMGDAGSIPLGFMAAAMGMWGWRQGCWDVWFPLLVFSPFVLDASVTLFKRTLRGEKLTEAHRDHYYQRAIRMGWSHRRVALLGYGLMLGCGASAWAVYMGGYVWPVLFIWACIYGGLMYALDVAWKRHERSLNV
ncbi:MAG: glycosyltransferase family 4 protein [Pseudomonadota bacterium]